MKDDDFLAALREQISLRAKKLDALDALFDSCPPPRDRLSLALEVLGLSIRHYGDMQFLGFARQERTESELSCAGSLCTRRGNIPQGHLLWVSRAAGSLPGRFA